MADFKKSFERRIPIEGGFCNEHNDSGNWTGEKVGVGEQLGTNWGITCSEYGRFLGRTPRIEEMKSMPREHAEQIFLENYWTPMHGGDINSQDIANNMYDSCVNMGLITGIKYMQEAVGVAITGKVDQIFIDKLNNKA